MRLRVAVDADVDQHGPTPVHRGAAVPVPVDTSTGVHVNGAHVADRADGVPARRILVSRATRPERHHPGVHAGVPQERHVPAVHRVHRVRGVAVLRAAAIHVRVPLPADIPQAEQDAAEDRTVHVAPVQLEGGVVAE